MNCAKKKSAILKTNIYGNESTKKWLSEQFRILLTNYLPLHVFCHSKIQVYIFYHSPVVPRFHLEKISNKLQLRTVIQNYVLNHQYKSPHVSDLGKTQHS